MTADRPPRSLAELHAASNRLWYEYWMLRCTARARSDDPSIARALEESFALHFRNLHAFLYAADASESTEARADRVTAEDFLGARWSATRPEPSALLVEAATWAQEKLRNVTHSDANSAPNPPWTLLEVCFALQKTMDPFISSTPRELLGERWKIEYEGGSI